MSEAAVEYKQTRQGYVDALIALAAEDPRVLVLDADVAKASKTCDFEQAFPDRFFNCGIQEQNMMSVAAGLAIEGFLPFATTFGVFAACRAADQVRNSIAYPKLNVKIGATHCGVTTGGDGASHQANEDIAILRAIPNMTILVPGDYEEARLATLAAAAFVGPAYIRAGRDNYRVVLELHGRFEIGKAKVLRPVGEWTIVSTGILTAEALEAAGILEEEGIHAGVIHMPTIKPLDRDCLLAAARGSRGFVTVEEHSILGGLGEAVCGVLAEEMPRPVARIGMRDTADELLTKFGLRAVNIVESVRRLAAR
ncbi:MAG: transketolase C-terminal domain-containing protein [Bryobacteraceae bacterium]